MYIPVRKEGFETPSPIPGQIKSTLDSMTVPEICPIIENIRDFMKKNEMTQKRISSEEATRTVEATLASKISGGALPCPLLTYPADTAPVEEWISFLESVPVDYGSRVVFMILYAKEELETRVIDIDAALQGKPNKTESFTVFPPTVSDTRSMERLKNPSPVEGFEEKDKDKETPEQKQQKRVKTLLDKLVKTRNDNLSGKGLSSNIDLAPYIASAQQSIAYIKDKQNKLNDGSIVNDIKLS